MGKKCRVISDRFNALTEKEKQEIIEIVRKQRRRLTPK